MAREMEGKHERELQLKSEITICEHNKLIHCLALALYSYGHREYVSGDQEQYMLSNSHVNISRFSKTNRIHNIY